MNLSRSITNVFAGHIAAAIVGLAWLTLFARELSPSQLGSFFLFFLLLELLSITANLGIREAVEKRISENFTPADVLATAMVIKIVPLVITIVGVWVLQNVINEYVGAPVAMYLVIGIVLLEYAELPLAVLRGELRVGETAWLRLLFELVLITSGMFFLSVGLELRGLIYALLMSYSAMLIVGAYRVSISIGEPSLEIANSLFNFSRFETIVTMGNYAYNWMDVAVIGVFLSQSYVGSYEVAWRITSAAMLFSKAISLTIFPQMSAWNSIGDINPIKRAVEIMVPITLILLVPAIFGAALLSRDILSLVFGESYVGAWLVLVILILGRSFEAIYLVFVNSLRGINRPNFAARSILAGLLLNLCLNIGLTYRFGIIGAAIGTTLSFAGTALLSYRYLSQFISFRVPYRKLGWLVVSSSVMFAILSWSMSIKSIESIPDLLIVIVLGSVIYGGTLLLTPLRADIIRCIQLILNN